ncbi:hypothetical protein ONA70_25995 [Micromonospora yasonensis]|uniref:hypothetical protein n=1 Tax=Micromonospora yasonensis TaxID=1128667 RepID=UPI0022316BA0|nr:hypothetical protein [Micromonospora yasonensis]MCW3843560.1 hypothetical protein [Micromonospora yasonensis]
MNEDRLRFDLADLADEVTPVDLRDRALRTSRRLGIQRAVTTSAAALVMIAAATGTALAIRPNEQSGPAPATSVTATPTPTPERASPSPSTAEPADAPMAPVTADEARNASIRLGKWSTDFCPAGTYRFNDGNSVYKPLQDSPRTFSILGDPVIADVDRDGDLDAVVLVTCSPFAVRAQQVIALQRTESGAIATLGQVAVTGAQVGGGEITQVEATADGAVRVHWMDTQVMGDNRAAQWRVYRWSGHGFRQSDGPTSFPKVSVDLKIRAGQASLVQQPDNGYEGDLVVTVTNTGNIAADYPGIHLTLPASVSLTKVRGVVKNVAYVHDSGPPKVMLCELSAIPAGKSLTITFTRPGWPAFFRTGEELFSWAASLHWITDVWKGLKAMSPPI